MKKKLVNGDDFDGWAMRWPRYICAHTRRGTRSEVIKVLGGRWKWRKFYYRKGARIVKVKLVEVSDKRGMDAGKDE